VVLLLSKADSICIVKRTVEGSTKGFLLDAPEKASFLHRREVRVCSFVSKQEVVKVAERVAQTFGGVRDDTQ
jgi:hypothetical protein